MFGYGYDTICFCIDDNRCIIVKLELQRNHRRRILMYVILVDADGQNLTGGEDNF